MYAFQYCTNLKTVHIGDKVTSLGKCAFYSCAIRSLHLGKSITTFVDSAFNSDASVSVNSITNVTVSKGYHCPVSYMQGGFSMTIWRCFKDILENCAVYGEDGRTAATMTFKVSSSARTALTNAYNEGDETALAIYELMDSKSISITT
jgi:hypothetical protein